MHSAGQLGAGFDDEIPFDVDVSLELTCNAHAARTFDLAFDGDVGCNQRFPDWGAMVWERRESGRRPEGDFGLGRRIDPGLHFGRGHGGLPNRVVFPDGHGGASREGGMWRLALKRGGGN